MNPASLEDYTTDLHIAQVERLNLWSCLSRSRLLYGATLTGRKNCTNVVPLGVMVRVGVLLNQTDRYITTHSISKKAIVWGNLAGSLARECFNCRQQRIIVLAGRPLHLQIHAVEKYRLVPLHLSLIRNTELEIDSVPILIGVGLAVPDLIAG